MTAGNLYFVAIIPPEPVFTEIHAFKVIARDMFESSRALRSPPHITLLPPFRATTQSLKQCDKLLEQVSNAHHRFGISLSGFGAFPPKVVFVLPKLSDALRALQSDVEFEISALLGISRPTRPYHPHMTVAFKDLRKSMFGTAWNYFSAIDYERNFEVSTIVLLRHYSTGWRVSRQFALRG